MTALLLSVHVLAAVLTVGPVTVAASAFPRYADPARPTAAPAVARALHRICRVYATLGLVVPAFGLATAAALGVLTDAWVLVSMALTALAAGVLVLGVLPRQRALLSEPAPAVGIAGLAMATGAFNLLWATVVVLMIVRPGSTTGV